MYSLTDDPVEQVAVDSLYSQVHKSHVATTKLVFVSCFALLLLLFPHIFLFSAWLHCQVVAL
jgi:hypothetical protein